MVKSYGPRIILPLSFLKIGPSLEWIKNWTMLLIEAIALVECCYCSQKNLSKLGTNEIPSLHSDLIKNILFVNFYLAAKLKISMFT